MSVSWEQVIQSAGVSCTGAEKADYVLLPSAATEVKNVPITKFRSHTARLMKFARGTWEKYGLLGRPLFRWNARLAIRCSSIQSPGPDRGFIYSIGDFATRMSDADLSRMKSKDLLKCKKYLSEELRWKSSLCTTFGWVAPIVSSGCFLNFDGVAPACISGLFGFWFFIQRGRTAKLFETSIRRIDRHTYRRKKGGHVKKGGRVKKE